MSRLLLFVAVALAAGSSAAWAQATDWPLERPPRPLPARDVTFPDYTLRTLDNGLQVVIVPHHEQPAVTMRLLIRAGAVRDPDGKRGVASLVGSLLDQGTTRLSAQEVQDRIDSIGGLLGTGSTDDYSFINAVVMKDSFDVGMAMIADLARYPAFAPEEIERQVQQAISSQQVNASDPDYVASMLVDRLVYGFHSYGLPGSGTPATLAAITRQDLQAFHQTYFVPNNMILGIVGDVTTAEAVAAAERVFASWPRGEVPALGTTEPPPPTRRIVVVDKPDAVQTEIRVGQLAIPRTHDDFLAWDLAVKILGGEGANRLHRVLRSERGLTYGAEADVHARKLAGSFVAETDTRTETTGESLRLMVEEMARLQRQRVSEGELSGAQAYLAGSFPLTIETPNQIAAQVIENVFFELPVEEIETYRERLQAITPDDIQRVARQYIRPDRLSIVLVGNADAFIPQLKSVGFTDFEIIPIDRLDLMSATLRRDQLRVGLDPFEALEPFAFRPLDRREAAYTGVQVNPRAGRGTPSDSQVSNGLLRDVIAAKGGLEALRAVRTVIADAQTELQMREGTLASATRTYVLYPDRFRVEAEVEGMTVVQVYNAGHAWVQDPQGVRDAPPGAREEFAVSVRRDTIPLLLDAAAGRVSVRELPAQRWRDGRMLRVLELSGEGLDAVRLYVDDEMLIAGQAFRRQSPAGPILNEEMFSDYRTIDGVRIPFVAELLHNGQPILKRTLTSVSLTTPVAESLFTPPR